MVNDLKKAADNLEGEYLAVANGEKKYGKINLEALVKAVQVMRKYADDDRLKPDICFECRADGGCNGGCCIG